MVRDLLFWLIPVLGESIQSFTIKYDIVCGFSWMFFYQVEEVPLSISSLLSVFIMKDCLILSKALDVYESNHVGFVFYSIYVVCYVD